MGGWFIYDGVGGETVGGYYLVGFFCFFLFFDFCLCSLLPHVLCPLF